MHSGALGSKTFLHSTDTSRNFKSSTQTTGGSAGPCVTLSDHRCYPRSSVLPPSKREYPIRGLNLIRLLTQNRIADFHTTLESLPLSADQIVESPYISHPVNLERWLMEGSYSKVWNAREEAPTEEYKIFVDSLVGTIRLARFVRLVTKLLTRLTQERDSQLRRDSI